MDSRLCSRTNLNDHQPPPPPSSQPYESPIPSPPPDYEPEPEPTPKPFTFNPQIKTLRKIRKALRSRSAIVINY